MIFQHLHIHPHYFSRAISKDMKELFFSVGILGFAVSTVALFEPLYLYTRGFSVSEILLYFAVLYAVYFLVVPFGGKIVAHIGIRRGILIASFMLIGYYISLFAMEASVWFALPAILFGALQKTFYWPSFHKDFIETSDAVNRGREVSVISSVLLSVSVVGPIFGGIMLTYTSFPVLFSIAIVLIFLSNIPLFSTKTTLPKEHFSIVQSWKMLIEPAHRRVMIAYIGFGEEIVQFTVWPLFLFLVVDSTTDVGLFLGAGTLASALFLLLTGKYIDRRKDYKHSFLQLASGVLSLSWLVRIFVFLPLPAFTSNLLGGVVKDFSFVQLSTLTYERARKEHPLAYGVFIEQSLALGKALIGVALAALFVFMGFFGVWLVAAAFALLYGIYPRSR
ncbi:MAG: MFS transporter [Patescibacteria group bacterium]|jgi:MFS family permease